MGKAFGLVMMMIALYVGMTVQAEGMQNAFGGIFAPIEPIGRDSSAATALSPHAQSADDPSAPEPRGNITDRFRQRVEADMKHGAERRGY